MTRSRAHAHAHRAVRRQHERLALLLRFTDHDFAQTAVATNGRVRVQQPRDQSSTFVRLSLFGELVSHLDRESARTSERLDGLHTTVVPTGDDPLDRINREQAHETQRLPAPTLVERPPQVVTFPLRAAGRSGCARRPTPRSPSMDPRTYARATPSRRTSPSRPSSSPRAFRRQRTTMIRRGVQRTSARVEDISMSILTSAFVASSPAYLTAQSAESGGE